MKSSHPAHNTRLCGINKDLLSTLETIKIRFVADATGHDNDGTALPAALKTLPDRVGDVLFRHENGDKKKRKVYFNEAVEVRFFRFTPEERQWRRINIGSTQRLWDSIAAGYNARWRAAGKAFCATPHTSQKLRMIPGRWLGDTGASWHMVSPQDLPPQIRSKRVPCKREIWLDTANGPLKATHEVPLADERLPSDIAPILLENTPAVLSVGKFCMEAG